MSCDCGSQKNQTSSSAIKFLADNGIDMHTERGAGLFLLAAPEQGPIRFQKIMVDDLSYIDVKMRGIYCLAYKWFPYSWKDKNALSSISLSGCHGESCSSNADCEKIKIECFCFMSECV